MDTEAIEQAADMGRKNLRAINLLANHCSHAQLEIPGGTSMVGAMLGLPIGMARVRCPHAPSPRQMSMHGMDLAVSFYEENCEGCPHRRPSGLLPTIATEAAERRERAEAARAQQEAADLQAGQQWERRRAVRRSSVAMEGYPVRDLADDLDLIDSPPGQPAEGYDEAARLARRRIVETARRAPQLFTGPLTNAVTDFAEERLDSTACTAVRLLARAGQVTRRRAAAVGAAVLSSKPVAEAGQLIAEFATELTPAQRSAVLAGAITLAGDNDDGFPSWRGPAEPAALLALAHVDLVSVTEGVVSALGDDSDQARADAAETCRYLLLSDPGRVLALGGPLVASIRGEDEGYAGTPSPSSAAARALAEAWRGEPETTRAIVEAGATALTEEGRTALAAVVRFLRRWHDDTPVPDPAVRTAVAFLLRRLDGGWGGDVADKATDDLLALAEEYPDAVLRSADGILAALLAACQAPQANELTFPEIDDKALARQVHAMERASEEIRRGGRRQDLAKTVGLLARYDPESLVPKVSALLGASTGDSDLDSTTRSALVAVMETSVTAATVESVLPALYSCLLGDDQAVRGAAVALWRACAQAADTLPEDLTDLASTLLLDRYVIVHRAMLRDVPSLGLPDATAATLLPGFIALANAYASDESETLDLALHGVLWSARAGDDDQRRRFADTWVLRNCAGLNRYDRERLLLDRRLEWLRPTQEWAAAALDLLADPTRPDRFNARDDRLLAALLEEPRGLRGVSASAFRAAADIHLPEYVTSAAQPVALLQAAGRRWADAASLATEIAERVPDTREHASGRRYLVGVAAAARAEEAAANGHPVPPLPARAETLGHDAPGGRGQEAESASLGLARVRAEFRRCLETLPPWDPAAGSEAAERAADAMAAAAFGPRELLSADAYRCAAHLLRHDAAVRTASAGDADAHLAAARRTAAVLAARAESQLTADNPGLLFARAVADPTTSDLDAALMHLRDAPFLLPLWMHAVRDRPAANTVSAGSAGSASESRRSRRGAGEDGVAVPTAVCVLSLDDDPVVDVVVVRAGDVYDLTIDIRLDHWPAWAESCHVSLLSLLTPDALTVTHFAFTRGDAIEDEHGVTLTRTGTLRCTAQRAAGRPPLDLPLHIWFDGAGRTGRIDIGGYRRLRLRPYDPSRDAITQHRQIDQRLLELYDPLHDDRTLDTDDVAAFCRLFTACVRAAQSIMFDVAFRAGRKVTEEQFHDDLEARLRADPELEGRLTRRDPVAGGFDDLLHDDVIAELKVEKTTPRTVDGCARYLGQPTQYGVGRGSRLSILVVLDDSRKQSPPAVLENYIGWLLPRHHGLADPRYPSRVGVLIINSNWRVPSAWSRKRIAVAGE